MKSPVRILYILNSPEGGATQCALDIIRHLPRERYLFFLVVPTEPSGPQKEMFRSLGAEWKVIPMAWWNRMNRLSFGRRSVLAVIENLQTWGNLRPIYQISRRIREWRIDLVHTHSGVIPWGALAAKLCGVPHVWHIHEPHGNNAPFEYWFPDSLLAYLVHGLSDHVLLVSRYVGEVFYRYPGKASITVAYQGVDLTRRPSTKSRDDMRTSLGVSDKHMLIGMVAGLTSTWKQHDLFIRTAGRLSREWPEARFVIFGNVPRKPTRWLYNTAYEYTLSLKQLVQEEGLAERFIWAGFTQDVPALMSSLDILVHPCEVEGFGRIAIEAMAAGKPVVGPNTGGVAESVLDGETGFLVAAGRVDAFASATAKLVGDPNLGQMFGDKGKAHVRERFSQSKHASLIDRIYSEICNPSDPCVPPGIANRVAENATTRRL